MLELANIKGYLDFKRYLNRFNQIGLIGFAFGIFERLRNYILYLIFGFDRWHVIGTYHLRPYKQQVTSAAQKLAPSVVLEVGGGLGDILSHIEAPSRYGVDMDNGVIRAASFLHGKECKFFVGELDRLNEVLSQIDENKIDVLIMVNWLHNIEFKNMECAIKNILKSKKIEYLVVDIISDLKSGYLYKHSIADLASIGKIIEIVDGLDGVREIITLRIGDFGSECQSL